MKKLLLSLLFVCLAVSMVFAQGAPEKEVVKDTIAVSIPITGNNAQYGVSYKNAIELAVEKFNAAGGLNGTPVKIEWFDDAGDKVQATNIANKIAEMPNVFAFIGSYGSTVSLPMCNILQEARIPVLSPNTSHPDYFSVGDMMMPISARADNCFNEVGNVLIKDYAPKKVGMIYENNDSGVENTRVIGAKMTSQGIPFESAPFVAAETHDFTPIITSIMTSNPDLVVICTTYQSAAEIIMQTRQLGYDKVTLVCIGSAVKPQILGLAGAYGNGVVFCTTQRLYTADILADNDYGEYVENLYAEYVKKYNIEFDGPASFAYDAAVLACDAAKNVGTNDPVAFINYCKQLKPELCSGGAWFEGDEFYRTVYSFKIENGKFVFLH